LVDDPAGPELVAPLSGPWRNWRKPLPAIVADAIANNRAIIDRLKLGMYGPDSENTSHYEKVFNKLCRSTNEQIAALEAFAAIDWR
jgi:hypothetical protein